jgi:hypothetical protein
MTSRQPEGIPVGGQFAVHAHAESNIALEFGDSPERRLSEEIAADIAAFRGSDDERHGRINAGMIMTIAMAGGKTIAFIRDLAEANLRLVSVGRAYDSNRGLTDDWWTGCEFQLRSVIQHIDVEAMRLASV